METSVFIARILGIFYLTAATGMILNRKFYRHFMEEFCGNPVIIFFSGMLALIIGLVIVLTHNKWEADWSVIITVIGWIGLIKGVWIIIFPNSITRVMRFYKEKEYSLLIHSTMAFILGVCLAFFGFFRG